MCMGTEIISLLSLQLSYSIDTHTHYTHYTHTHAHTHTHTHTLHTTHTHTHTRHTTHSGLDLRTQWAWRWKDPSPCTLHHLPLLSVVDNNLDAVLLCIWLLKPAWVLIPWIKLLKLIISQSWHYIRGLINNDNIILMFVVYAYPLCVVLTLWLCIIILLLCYVDLDIVSSLIWNFNFTCILNL